MGSICKETTRHRGESGEGIKGLMSTLNYIKQQNSFFSGLLIVFLVSFIFSVDLPITEKFALLVPAEVILAILVFLIILDFLLRRVLFIPWNTFVELTILFFLYNLLNTLVSKHVVVSAKAFIRESLYYIPLFIGILLFLRDEVKIKRLVVSIMTIGAIFALWGIYQQLSGTVTNYAVLGAPFFNEHGSYGVYMAFLFSFSLAFYLYGTTKLQKHLGLILTFLFFAAVILSFAKAAWISVLIVFIVLPAIDRRKFDGLRGITICVVLVIGLGIFLILFLSAEGYRLGILKFLFSLEYAANQERVNRVATAINMFKDNPIFGVGIRSYIFEYDKYKTIIFPTIHSEFERMSSHNQYLDILANRGIVGFILFFALITTFLRSGLKGFRTCSNRWKPLILGALLGNITYFIHWLFNTLWVGKLEALFWLCFAIVAFGISSGFKKIRI